MAYFVGYRQRYGRGQAVDEHHRRSPQSIRALAKTGRAELISFAGGASGFGQEVGKATHAQFVEVQLLSLAHFAALMFSARYEMATRLLFT